MTSVWRFSIVWLVATLLGGLSVIVAMPALAQEKSMSNIISYTSNKADDRFETELTVRPDGAAVLKIGSNRDRRSGPAGLFRAVVPAHLIAQLSRDTTSPAFLGAPSQVQLVPDETFREIKVIGPENSPLVKLVGEELATPAPFAQAESTIESIILFLLKSPVVAIVMQVSMFPEQVIAGQRTPFDLVLGNVGQKPFFLDAPTQWGEKASQGDLVAVRTDIPLAELTSAHQQFLPLGRSNFEVANPSIIGPRVRLGPGEGIALRFQSDFSWEPGRYKVDIDLVLPLLGDDDKPLMLVGLVSESKPVSVSAK
ncbi:MAG: hypothetical protein IPL99_01255 [Candidatus Competibacteraceae bacterium]|nr:hypothetical protein [Candidatus Competibacteraceae bacterium]